MPPTGARGLNTAASDVYYLYHALVFGIERTMLTRHQQDSGKIFAKGPVWQSGNLSVDPALGAGSRRC